MEVGYDLEKDRRRFHVEGDHIVVVTRKNMEKLQQSKGRRA
jgi:hypothetical protein